MSEVLEDLKKNRSRCITIIKEREAGQNSLRFQIEKLENEIVSAKVRLADYQTAIAALERVHS